MKLPRACAIAARCAAALSSRCSWSVHVHPGAPSPSRFRLLPCSLLSAPPLPAIRPVLCCLCCTPLTSSPFSTHPTSLQVDHVTLRSTHPRLRLRGPEIRPLTVNRLLEQFCPQTFRNWVDACLHQLGRKRCKETHSLSRIPFLAPSFPENAECIALAPVQFERGKAGNRVCLFTRLHSRQSATWTRTSMAQLETSSPPALVCLPFPPCSGPAPEIWHCLHRIGYLDHIAAQTQGTSLF